MKHSICRILPALALFATVGAVWGQSNSATPTVAIPSTGAGRTATATKGADKDSFWRVVKTDIPGASTGSASIVDVLPGGWTKTDDGSAWISWDSNQTNASRPGTCCKGTITYEVKFEVADAAKAVAQLKISGDEVITMYLNGASDTNIVYSTIGSTFTAPVARTLVQGAPYTDPGGYSHTVRFVNGVNTLTVEVLNFGGGPTGLYINAVLPAGNHPPFIDSAPADGHANATPDPVDSGSGQFYDTETDFNLGGPLAFSFERYYASQLAKSGLASALGANWMSTYDVTALVNGAKAQVLLFGGRVVNFTNTANTWQLTSPLNVGYQFATTTGGFQFLDPRSKRVYTFSATGALTRIEDRNGNAITATQGANGPTKVSDGLGRTLTFTYTGNQLSSVQDQAGRLLNFTYSGGLLATATDAMKGVTKYSYATVGASTGLLTKETLPLGNAPVSQTYDATGRVTAQTDGNNNTTKIAYDGLGTTTVTDANNSTTRHRNDAVGNLAQISDPLGAVASVSYDSALRRTSISDKSGGLLQYLYHQPTGEIAAITDALGKTTSYSYTPQTKGPFTFYNLSQIDYPDGKKASMSYDPNGNLLSVTTQDGAVRGFAYDSLGRLTKSTDALGKVTTYTWNPDSTVATQQDALGNVTKFEYDSVKKLAKLTDPNGSTASYVYDGNGRTIVGPSPGAKPWTAHFDANGQEDALINPFGARWAFTYTATGKIATATDPLKNVTAYGYDKLDRLVKVANAVGEAVVYTYDAAGRITATADNAGPRLKQTFDAEGRVLGRTDGAGVTVLYTYDKAGRPTAITTASGNTVSATYDSKGNQVSRTNAVGDQYQKTYDAMGRLLTITGPGGAMTSFKRDAEGRPTAFTSANGGVWTMAYDAAGRIASLGDPLGNATNYTYKGTRRAKIDFPLGSASFTYDAAGRPTKVEYSDGAVVNNTYDASGLLIASDGLTIERNSMGVPRKINGIAMTVDAAGKPLTLTYAQDKAITYAYDKAGRVTSVADWTGGKTDIVYDAASRRLSHTFPNGVTTNYGYDADGRLTSIAYGALGSIQLTLDGAGKTLAADRNLPIAPVLQDDARQLAYDQAGQLTTATYDTMGRVTAQDNRAYTWNLANQLVSFADPVNAAANTYDGKGEIRSISANGGTQNYVFNYATQYPSLAIVRQGSDDLRYFVYLPTGELLYSIEAATGDRRMYHFDEMGNTVFLTDNSGTMTDSYAITPYGEVADHIGPSDNPFTWQGQYGAIQEGNGLYYLRSRHYDTSTARFLSPDPIRNAEPQSSEPYAYARGNPLLYQDPFGTSGYSLNGSAFARTYGEVLGRFTFDVGQLNFGDPQFAYLAIVIGIVGSSPDADPQAVVDFVRSFMETPPPPPPAPVSLPLLSSSQLPATGTCVTLQCASAAPYVRNGDASLISQDGAGLISQDGAGLISQDGAGLISQDGAGLISQDGAGLISQDGAGLISQDGAGVISHDGGGFVPKVSPYRSPSPASKAKNKKK